MSFYITWLLVGFVAVTPLLLFAQKLPPRAMHKLLGRSLVIAAIIYIGFAVIWGNISWVGIESAGVVLYSFFYWLSLRWGINWLAVGWLLHTIWDVALHLLGPGHSIAPASYAVVCISFDFAVAFYILFKSRQFKN